MTTSQTLSPATAVKLYGVCHWTDHFGDHNYKIKIAYKSKLLTTKHNCLRRTKQNLQRDKTLEGEVAD